MSWPRASYELAEGYVSASSWLALDQLMASQLADASPQLAKLLAK
jgi:hypothetical protein